MSIWVFSCIYLTLNSFICWYETNHSHLKSTIFPQVWTYIQYLHHHYYRHNNMSSDYTNMKTFVASPNIEIFTFALSPIKTWPLIQLVGRDQWSFEEKKNKLMPWPLWYLYIFIQNFKTFAYRSPLLYIKHSIHLRSMWD